LSCHSGTKATVVVAVHLEKCLLKLRELYDFQRIRRLKIIVMLPKIVSQEKKQFEKPKEEMAG
jgi:hypothetical protein